MDVLDEMSKALFLLGAIALLISFDTLFLSCKHFVTEQQRRSEIQVLLGRRVTLEDKQECSMCLEEMSCDGVTSLPCGHHFHRACIEKWLHVNTYRPRLCPLCRQPFLKTDTVQCKEEEDVVHVMM